MFTKVTIIFILIHFRATVANIILNNAHLEYVSDRLTPIECLKLVAALNIDSFEIPNDYETEVRKYPRQEPCMDLLASWNKKVVEGGPTQLSRRLSQIGREDLASWITAAVFKDLTVKLEESIKDKVGPSPVEDALETNDELWTEVSMDVDELEQKFEANELSDKYDVAKIAAAILAVMTVLLAALKLLREHYTQNKE